MHTCHSADFEDLLPRSCVAYSPSTGRLVLTAPSELWMIPLERAAKQVRFPQLPRLRKELSIDSQGQYTHDEVCCFEVNNLKIGTAVVLFCEVEPSDECQVWTQSTRHTHKCAPCFEYNALVGHEAASGKDLGAQHSDRDEVLKILNRPLEIGCENQPFLQMTLHTLGGDCMARDELRAITALDNGIHGPPNCELLTVALLIKDDSPNAFIECMLSFRGTWMAKAVKLYLALGDYQDPFPFSLYTCPRRSKRVQAKLKPLKHTHANTLPLLVARFCDLQTLTRLRACNRATKHSISHMAPPNSTYTYPYLRQACPKWIWRLMKGELFGRRYPVEIEPIATGEPGECKFDLFKFIPVFRGLSEEALTGLLTNFKFLLLFTAVVMLERPPGLSNKPSGGSDTYANRGNLFLGPQEGDITLANLVLGQWTEWRCQFSWTRNFGRHFLLAWQDAELEYHVKEACICLAPLYHA